MKKFEEVSRINRESLFHLKLKDLTKLPESIMLVGNEAHNGTGNYTAVETFDVTRFLDNEIAEIRNRGDYHTVYVYAD